MKNNYENVLKVLSTSALLCATLNASGFNDNLDDNMSSYDNNITVHNKKGKSKEKVGLPQGKWKELTLKMSNTSLDLAKISLSSIDPILIKKDFNDTVNNASITEGVKFYLKTKTIDHYNKEDKERQLFVDVINPDTNETISTKDIILNIKNIVRFDNQSYVIIQSEKTARVWLKKNIGSKKKYSLTHYYQWGRIADGHQLSNSTVDLNISDNINPQHSNFILSNNDWVSNDKIGDNRFQVWGYAKNSQVCPVGFRIPTKEEVLAEHDVNSSMHGINISLDGYRDGSDSGNGAINEKGEAGYIWTLSQDENRKPIAVSNKFEVKTFNRADGLQIKCIDEGEHTINFAPIINNNIPKQIEIETKKTKEDNYINVKDLNNDELNISIDSNDTDLTVNYNFDRNITSDQYNTNLYYTLSNNASVEKTMNVIISITDGNTTRKRKMVVQSKLSNDSGGKNEVKDRHNEKLTYNIITSPYTGKKWLDKNLGARAACTDSTSHSDQVKCVGYYYQWGRGADGHHKKKLIREQTVDFSDNKHSGINPDHGKFIYSSSLRITDWVKSDINGSKRAKTWSEKICPVGFKVPTSEEIKSEFKEANASGDYRKYVSTKHFLKLPISGYRTGEATKGADAIKVSYYGEYNTERKIALWSNSPNYKEKSKYAKGVSITKKSKNYTDVDYRRYSALQVRCIEE